MPRVIIESVSDDIKTGSKGYGQTYPKEGSAPFKGARVGPVIVDYTVEYTPDQKLNFNQTVDARKRSSSPCLDDDDYSALVPIRTSTTTTSISTTTTTPKLSPRSQKAQLRQAILNKNVYLLQTLVSRLDPETNFSEESDEEAGADSDADADGNGDNDFCAGRPLHLAAQKGFADGVKIIFFAGANPDAADEFGLSPLHYAIMSGSAETVRLLSQLGSNLNVADNDGDTPLHYAVRESNSDIVKILIDFGVNPKIENCDGETPYSLACELNETDISIQLAHCVRRISSSFRWAAQSGSGPSPPFPFV